MGYTIHEHQHRFAAWAASRAASTTTCRFSVERGMSILEACKFDHSFSVPQDLPAPNRIDRWHRKKRIDIVSKARNRGLKFKHGTAAKLLNVYLKSRAVCAEFHKDARVKALHPPVDRTLLLELASADKHGRGNQWRTYAAKGWSHFDSRTYEKVIELMRASFDLNDGMWHIERYWPGHQ